VHSTCDEEADLTAYHKKKELQGIQVFLEIRLIELNGFVAGSLFLLSHLYKITIFRRF